MTTLSLKNNNDSDVRISLRFVEHGQAPSVLFDMNASGQVCSNLSLDSAKQLHSALTSIMKEVREFEERPKFEVENAQVVTFKGNTYFLTGTYEAPEGGSIELDLYTQAHLVIDRIGKVIKNRGGLA